MEQNVRDIQSCSGCLFTAICVILMGVFAIGITLGILTLLGYILR
jgi:hypothetical protein